MSYVSTAEPVRLGYLMDCTLPCSYPQEIRESRTNLLPRRTRVAVNWTRRARMGAGYPATGRLDPAGVDGRPADRFDEE